MKVECANGCGRTTVVTDKRNVGQAVCTTCRRAKHHEAKRRGIEAKWL
jgi:hypothetical protein